MPDNDDRKEMRQLCLLIGRTLLLCQVVESCMHRLLNQGGAGADFGSWLVSGTNPPSMKRAILELRRRFGIDQDFYDDLDQFRLMRNQLAHGLFELSDQRLSTPEGITEAIRFIDELNQLAVSLNNVLYPAVLDGYRQLLGKDEQWLEQWLTRSHRDLLSED